MPLHFEFYGGNYPCSLFVLPMSIEILVRFSLCLKQLVCQYLLAIITFVEHWSHLFLFICVSLAIVVSVCYNTPHTTTQSQTDAVHFSSAHFGAGIGPIHMSNVDCNGRESNLIDCSRSSTVNCTNGHSEDAGVRCQGNFIQCFLDLLWSQWPWVHVTLFSTSSLLSS